MGKENKKVVECPNINKVVKFFNLVDSLNDLFSIIDYPTKQEGKKTFF